MRKIAVQWCPVANCPMGNVKSQWNGQTFRIVIAHTRILWFADLWTLSLAQITNVLYVNDSIF